ncbi:MAG: anhydro-N-acetylmuramic acid kinase [Emcibacter sp.]|nr:anhydro-N-acetylmuramic acid kinase [Emcibacter sp.]
MKSEKGPFLAIGLMSGTSMDGVDCALVESDGHWVKPVLKPIHISYAPPIRREISQAMELAVSLGHPTRKNEQLNHLERTLTDIHAQAISKILTENNLSHEDIDIIGFHGQTLCHRPNQGWSWQIGDGQYLADRTQIAVVNDFRRHDVENGGQGAPLVPIYHQALINSLPDADYPIALINIGGVGNITWIGSKNEGRMLAFDTGPGNAFLDDWVEQHTGDPMDRDGFLSAQGAVDHSLVEHWLQSSYFFKMPPKSLDRASFNVAGLEKLSLVDGAATLVEFTAKSIEMALNHCAERPKYIYICGGGRHNKTLMSRLEKMTIAVDVVEKLGWQGDFMEAEAFAYLACRHLCGLPITFPGTTGINQSSPGGILSKPILITQN